MQCRKRFDRSGRKVQITLKKVELALKEMQQRKEKSYDLVG